VVSFGGDPANLSTAMLTNTTTVTASAVMTTAAPVAAVNAAPALGTGNIYFSARDVDDRSAVFMVEAIAGAQAERIVPDAIQPVMHPQGGRLAFHSTRDDMLGLGGYDLSTIERLRFAYNIEDALPTWNPNGDQLYFASTRYGDGRWRLYQLWADGNGEATDMRYGQDPAWHPSAERIVFKGCDEAGGNCGLWIMNSDGSERQTLTSNSGDARPRWTPDGENVVFMSDQRDGNWDVYVLNVASGAVTRLTTNLANDGLPVVSPDGAQVAFYSDRESGWAIWVAPLAGGTAERITSLGDLPNWLEQGMDWTR
jgi:Tol biopolymer transport system component